MSFHNKLLNSLYQTNYVKMLNKIKKLNKVKFIHQMLTIIVNMLVMTSCSSCLIKLKVTAIL